jgi:hypothetical protein
MNTPAIYHQVCLCLDPEHDVRFTHYADDEIYISIHLPSEVLYKRIWIGIKYIFGHKSRYGHFSETIMDRKTAKDFQEYLYDYVSKEQ